MPRGAGNGVLLGVGERKLLQLIKPVILTATGHERRCF
jgi:hypothetical protein